MVAVGALLIVVEASLGQTIRERIQQRRAARTNTATTQDSYRLIAPKNDVCVDCGPQSTSEPGYVVMLGDTRVVATPVSAPVVLSSDIQPSVLASKDRFRRSLLKAIASARKKGEINGRQAIRLRVASFSPAFLERAEELAVVQMVFSGESDDAIPRTDDGKVDKTSIDWDAFASFLERLLPLILQLISAFG